MRTFSLSYTRRVATSPSSRSLSLSLMYRPLVTDGSTEMPGPRSPLDLLQALGAQEHAVTAALRHVEVYTMEGLLTLLWHGDRDASDVLVTCGGGMGGLLGPGQ